MAGCELRRSRDLQHRIPQILPEEPKIIGKWSLPDMITCGGQETIIINVFSAMWPHGFPLLQHVSPKQATKLSKI
jgi:hypothetical protein